MGVVSIEAKRFKTVHPLHISVGLEPLCAQVSFDPLKKLQIFSRTVVPIAGVVNPYGMIMHVYFVWLRYLRLLLIYSQAASTPVTWSVKLSMLRGGTSTRLGHTSMGSGGLRNNPVPYGTSLMNLRSERCILS